ncbi:hypothetical protein LCGC14_1509470 [marine sediment metagenome]|uniref:Uncharacterized protein n=1 Tax=marine sediment metagenome TaxID=412755 RepID=A0A0F9JMI8_9ZZZZ
MTKHYRDEHLKKALASNAPKWLKQIFRTVCQDLDALEEDMREMFGKEETNVSVIKMAESQALPKNSRLEFMVNGMRIGVRIQKEHNGESLEINSSDGFLFINPQASNSCNIRAHDNF